MEGFILFLKELFITPSVTQTIVVLSLVCSVGLLLAKLPMGKFSLGITWVFFVGILASHFGLVVDIEKNSFAQSLGLVLFIYALGLQVGPSFFPSLKSGGIKENLISLLVVAFGLLLCVVYVLVFKLPVTEIVGVLSGATTNTPILAAAQSTLEGSGDAVGGNAITNMALACAVSYPMGVVGMILVLIIMDSMQKGKGGKREKKHKNTVVVEIEVSHSSVTGKTIQHIAKQTALHFVISRVWHKDKVELPSSQTILEEGDHILVVCKEEEKESIIALLGKSVNTDWNRKDIDWNHVDALLISKRLIVTNKHLNGAKLESLRLRTLYGINVTRIDRSGVELFATPDLHLQLGDRITIVGSQKAIESVEKHIGNEVKLLDAPNLISLFFGLLLGCILGMVPIILPGVSTPIKLGLAGGPIIVGILMGAYGPRLRLTTYMTNSASLLIRQIGILIFLAALGLSCGQNFFSTIVHGDGLLWIGLGVIVTIVPPLIVGWLSIKFWKMSVGSTCGMLCGSMANPMALTYMDGRVSDDSHNVSYATVYPLNMFIRIITAQLLIILLI